MTATASVSNATTPTQERGSYWITTFGCQMNKADSERMAGILQSMGYREASAELDADLVLYNTRTIRDNAEQKVTATWAVRHSANGEPESHPGGGRLCGPARGRIPVGECRSWIW